MIKVIEQSTDERNEETKNLFEQIKPLLDKGHTYMGACVIIGRVPEKNRHRYYNVAWFKELKDYGSKCGYLLHHPTDTARKTVED